MELIVIMFVSALYAMSFKWCAISMKAHCGRVQCQRIHFVTIAMAAYNEISVVLPDILAYVCLRLKFLYEHHSWE